MSDVIVCVRFRACWVTLPMSGWGLVRPGVHQRLSDETRTGAAQQQQLLQTHTPQTHIPHTNNECNRERGSAGRPGGTPKVITDMLSTEWRSLKSKKTKTTEVS